MESCRSVTLKVDTKLQPPTTCHLPVYSTLSHLITVLEKLRTKDYAVPDNPEQLSKILLDTARDMEVKTGANQSNQDTSVIGTLEMELKKLQQTNLYLAQESSSQQKSLRNMEQRIKPLQEKNKKFLEKNIELTSINRNLKDQTQNVNDENKKLKNQCEQCRKRVKQLTQQLTQEKMEKGDLELKLQEMEKLKQKLSEQTKTVEALKLNVVEKDRRIELVQHRKRRKKVLRNYDKCPGMKETSFGYDEDETSIDSETSLSLSACTVSDDELSEELSRKELESNYEKLMKEHLELQKLNALLQSKNGSNIDAQREGKLRSQLEASLYATQCKIEQLKETLQGKDEIINALEEDKEDLQSMNRAVTMRNIDLESKLERMDEKLNESQEMVETLEFQIIEMETQNPDQFNDDRVGLETIPEDPLEMNEAGAGGKAPELGMEGAHGKDTNKYIKTLEHTAQELQNKVSQLQEQNAILEEKCIKAQRDTPTLEEREAQEVLAVKESLAKQLVSTHNATHQAICHDPQEIPEILPLDQRESMSRSQSASPCRVLDICEVKFSKGELSDLQRYATELSSSVHRLEEENSLLKEQMQDRSLVSDVTDDMTEENSELEQKMEDMKLMCESLQERIYCSETSEKLLKDKLKLAEYTINDLEGSETSIREQLEKARHTEADAKKLLTEAQHKIRELKEIILDKDVIETSLAEKVQFLEKAEELSTQKITELETQNQLLQQRLDLKEDLEADILLVETLKDKITIYEDENKFLNEKVNELEENEEILKINWMKVAENDANRISSLEEKLRNVESLNKDLRCRMREFKEKTDLPSCPSLAAELSESDKSESSLSNKSKTELESRIKNLEEELQKVQDSKDTKIENLQDEIAKLKDNEIKLSETVVEMELAERELKSRLSLHQQRGSSVEKMMQYEGKIRNMESSHENLLNRIDSMEDHEVDLKSRLRAMEEKHERQLSMLEKEVAQYIEQEEDMTSRLLEVEKHEEELLEKVTWYEEHTGTLENKLSVCQEKETELVSEIEDIEKQNELLKLEIEKLQNSETKWQKELVDIQKENQDLYKTIDNITEELEQVQAENGDLNERLIELDSSEQECMEKLQKIEKDSATLEYFRNKVQVLEDAESKLMDRVTELEEIEMKLQSDIENYQIQNKDLSVVSNGNESISNKEILHLDKETDTNDLSDTPAGGKGRKLTGMFERLQELETDNQTLLEQLNNLQDADSLNKQLNEKVKLLENSEDKLMERVMELEEIEDRQKREITRLKSCANMEVPDIVEEISELRQTVELMKVNVEMLKADNEEYQDKIKEYVDKISELETEISDQKEKTKHSQETVQDLQLNVNKSDQLLTAEKQKVTSFLQGEERLFKSLAAEKNKTEDLERELSLAKDKLEEVQTHYEMLISQMKETISHKESKEEEYKKNMSELSQENEVLLKLIENNKSKSTMASSDCESDDDAQEFYDANTTSVNNQNDQNINSTPYNAQNKRQFGAIDNVSDISGIVPIVDIVRCRSCGAVQTELPTLSSEENTVIGGATELQSPVETIQTIMPTSSLCKTQINATSVDSEDSFFGLNQTEEFCKRIQQKQQQCDEAALKVTIAEYKCKVKELEDQLEAFQRAISDIVDSYRTLSSGELTDYDRDVGDTFRSKDSLVNLDPTMVKSIEELEKCKTILFKWKSSILESKEHLRNCKEEYEKTISELQIEVNGLKDSESQLQQQVVLLESVKNDQARDHVDSAYSSSDVSQQRSEISSTEGDKEDLLRRIKTLEQSKRSLECRLEYFESVDVSPGKMLDKPEDILQQRITELEKLEKHLKLQVTDLEQDREELHEIARKDKNTIHEQNIRIRELQLAEKNMKAQISQFEISERNLYNKVEELEDQISTMEVRISELSIMEMRLKELVRKYKLDEEVWLSNSENLTSSISQLSMSESQLKKQLENVEKEKQSLEEKSEYMELRLKEVENAESNLLQRTKDQENKEISLNNKLSELQSMGSNAEMQVAELHAVNVDLSQRLNHAAQENAAMVHHITQLQNHTQMLNQQIMSLQETEGKLQQEKQTLESSLKELDNEVKESKIKEVQTEGKVRQLEENENTLKDKISSLQRSENRLKYQVQQLQTGSQVAIGDLSQSQREKLPRKLEDCQKRIIFLQNQNEELAKRLQEHKSSMTSKSVVNIPQREFKQLQAKVALLEHTEAQLDEADQLNSHLRESIDELRQGKDVCGHEAEIDVLKNRLDESARTILTLRQLIDEGQYTEEGPIIHEEIKQDRSQVSHSMYNGEMPGHLAERRAKGQRSTLSSGAGHPVQKLANQVVYMDHKGRQPLDDHSDASTVEEEIISKKVQGRKSQRDPYSMATSDERRLMIDNLVSHLDIDDSAMPQEEAHWRTVESRRNHPPLTDDERWIHVGKATSLHSSVPQRSHHAQDEELVLGLTLPSEAESNMFTQNDTDSNMSSPAVKRRKFRPVHSTESNAPPLPQTIPPLVNSNTANRFGTSAYYMQGSVPDSLSEEEGANYYLGEEYKMIPGPSLTTGQRSRSRGSLPDSGHGTTSVASTGKTLSLREKIAEIGKTLQKRPSFTGTSDFTEEEDSAMYWKAKANDAERHMEDAENEKKYLKDEINKLEKDLEEKSRYIMVLENFISTLEQLLQLQGTKSDKELIQIVEAELDKTREEVKDTGCRKMDLSQDPAALSTELSKRERELSAKRNEVDGLMRELRQWQEECRTIEDMRTNALDALHCLEEEVSDLHSTERDLKVSKDAYNKLQEQYGLLQRRVRDLEVLEVERDNLEDEVAKLRSELKLIPQLKAEILSLEGRLESSATLVDNRSVKVKELIEEISQQKAKVISLERDNIQLQKMTVGFENLKSRFDEIKNGKNQAQMTVALMKAQVARLSQKCREKDDLLKRLGEEFRKLKGVGKPMMLLEELSQMERKMLSEEYNSQQQTNRLHSDYNSLGQHSRGQVHMRSMTDLKRSSSSSSLSDGQDNIAHSDTEVMEYSRHRLGERPHSADQWDRRQRPLSSQQHSQQLPNIYTSQHAPSYGPASDIHPVGHMPSDPMFIAVADYNPQQFSRSGRKAEELVLKEWDQVKVIGPLDGTGYYKAEVNGIQGLVPCVYLRQASLTNSKNVSRKQGQSAPAYLDASPEKIIQMHNQLNQSHRPSKQVIFPTNQKKLRFDLELVKNGSNDDYSGGGKSVKVNGHLADPSSKSPRGLTSSGLLGSFHQHADGIRGPPQMPSNFKIEKVINKQTLMLSWSPPSLNENNQSNGVKVIGYKIFLNGKMHQQASSPHIAKTLVKNVDVSRRQLFNIQTLGSGGQVSDLAEAVYEGKGRSVSDTEDSMDDLTQIMTHNSYKESQKRLFVGVYDFVPSPGKHGNMELAFQAGDRIVVYGEERLDGFYYGEINGKRGLVPGFFMEEIPLTSVGNR